MGEGQTQPQQATLYCPHSKEYCVGFQSKHATLKGIENGWHEVRQSCAWENQQHGRNHHVKVVLQRFEPGTVVALELCHEDGTPAPTFTRTKSGDTRATMLVGTDSREDRLGLTWHRVNQEGPRKWRPSSQVVVFFEDSKASRCSLMCERVSADLTSLAVPTDVEVIIPIRIEVLSASKSSDFSRYSIKVQQVNEAGAPRTPIPGGWSWISPPILIEAKWLPAAPVRLTNKANRQVSIGSSEVNEDSEVDLGKTSLSGMVIPLDSREASIQQIAHCCQLLAGVFGDPSHALIDSPQLDLCMQNLQYGISQYCMRRVTQLPHLQGPKIAHPEAKTKNVSSMIKSEKKSCKKQKTTHELLSSPPRGPKFAPISTEMMEAISLPGVAKSSRKSAALTLSSNASFADFDILATAASAAAINVNAD